MDKNKLKATEGLNIKLRKNINSEESRPTEKERKNGSFECDACTKTRPLSQGVQFFPDDCIILCDSCWETLHRIYNGTYCTISDAVTNLKKKRNEHIKQHLKLLEQD